MVSACDRAESNTPSEAARRDRADDTPADLEPAGDPSPSASPAAAPADAAAKALIPEQLPVKEVPVVAYTGPKATTLSVAPDPHNDAEPGDERLALAMDRYWYIGTLLGKLATSLAIVEGKADDPVVAAVHQDCLEVHNTIRLGMTWPDEIDGAAVTRCMKNVGRLLDERGWREGAAAELDRLAALTHRGRAYDLPTCHREPRDWEIARPRPASPEPLRRPAGVEAGATSNIIVRVDKAGESSLVAVVNDEDGPAARACFAAVDGPWSIPKYNGRPVAYCRFFRCAF